ncbi:uncharacterized protein LOC129949246 [Eupeodes corollae]|uniref:uncharacterized protein LOC129949246 n=1 Tax=Eupeodes corollae TaxID=290404 RepID=UPI0024928E17|nr:uncharacterized protein LOC129949246 [Eupeodes corollae]
MDVQSNDFVLSESVTYERDDQGNIILNLPSVPVLDQSQTKLDELLDNFNLPEAKHYLIRASITYESLQYLSKEDIKEAIPLIGLRATFREKLFSWRKTEFGIVDESLSDSIANKVVSWLKTQPIGCTTPTPSTSSYLNSQLSKKLEHLLEESLKGKAAKQFYKDNNHLIDSFRADVINIILEDIFFHKKKLTPKDFPPIIEEILELFPSEIKEYYFSPRGTKKNPGGKLWDRYVNQKAKRSRLLVPLSDNLEENSNQKDSVTKPSGLDKIETAKLLAFKLSLSRESSDWDSVKDKWQRTFDLRQKELKTSQTNVEFLIDWPLFTNAKAQDLINIDFDLLHPNKGHLLLSKWENFKRKIEKYYCLQIKDKKSREILSNSKGIADPNSFDYIFAVLLNSVILPTARFADKGSKLSRKISIPDANESFIVHLTTISDYKKTLSDLREKYFNKGLTVQPLLIVVGLTIYTLKEFYLYFDNTLLKFDSFLTSLDICFKLFQVLSLEYPRGCSGPWLFIQQHFYEIPLANCSKIPSICSLLNFLEDRQSN